MRLSITFKAVKHSFPQLVIKFSSLLDNKLASRWQGHKPEILLPSHSQTSQTCALLSVRSPLLPACQKQETNLTNMHVEENTHQVKKTSNSATPGDERALG